MIQLWSGYRYLRNWPWCGLEDGGCACSTWRVSCAKVVEDDYGCFSENPAQRAVFANCGHLTCVACAVMIAVTTNKKPPCPYCRTDTEVGFLFLYFAKNRRANLLHGHHALYCSLGYSLVCNVRIYQDKFMFFQNSLGITVGLFSIPHVAYLSDTSAEPEILCSALTLKNIIVSQNILWFSSSMNPARWSYNLSDLYFVISLVVKIKVLNNVSFPSFELLSCWNIYLE